MVTSGIRVLLVKEEKNFVTAPDSVEGGPLLLHLRSEGGWKLTGLYRMEELGKSSSTVCYPSHVFLCN